MIGLRSIHVVYGYYFPDRSLCNFKVIWTTRPFCPRSPHGCSFLREWSPLIIRRCPTQGGEEGGGGEDIPELAFTLRWLTLSYTFYDDEGVLLRGELGGEKTKLICDKEWIPFAFSFPWRPFIQQFWPLAGDDKLVSMWQLSLDCKTRNFGFWSLELRSVKSKFWQK